MNHAEKRIKNEFNEQRRLVQLETEQSISHIQKENERLVQVLNESEKRCLFQLEQNQAKNKLHFEPINKQGIIEYQRQVNGFLKKREYTIDDTKAAEEIAKKLTANIKAIRNK